MASLTEPQFGEWRVGRAGDFAGSGFHRDFATESQRAQRMREMVSLTEPQFGEWRVGRAGDFAGSGFHGILPQSHREHRGCVRWRRSQSAAATDHNLLSHGSVLAQMKIAEKLTVMFYVEEVFNQRVPL